MAHLHLNFRSIIMPICLVLGACAPADGEALWLDYLHRLERLTGTPIPPADSALRPRYPAHRELVQPIAEQRTGLVRYFNLLDCDLMALVSARNSSLGRVQARSLRLDHELQFIAGANACLADGRLLENDEMHRWLSAVTHEKQTMLPRHSWNLIFAGPEMNHFLRQRPVPAEQAVPPDWPAALGALEQLTVLATQLNGTPPTALDPAIENALERLDKSSAAGQILDAMALARRELLRATTMLNQVDVERLCPHGRASERARHLNNILMTLYAARLQPWLADLSRAGGPLANTMMSLRTAHPELESTALDRWLADQFGAGGLLSDYQDAIKQHTLSWQRVLDHCGLSPAATRRPDLVLYY
jgi:hypothetical protein